MRPHLCHGWCHLCSQVKAKAQGPVGFEVCPPEGSQGRTQIPSGWGRGASLGLGVVRPGTAALCPTLTPPRWPATRSQPALPGLNAVNAEGAPGQSRELHIPGEQRWALRGRIPTPRKPVQSPVSLRAEAAG